RPEGHRSAGCQIDEPDRAMAEDVEQERGCVVDIEVVAGLLAIAEQVYASLFQRLAQKSVGTVGIVRIAGAMDRGEAQHGEWRLGIRRKHELPRAVHGAVKIERISRRLLRD